ncbi:hypothetical protein H6G94_34270 [Nostoc punctiforme FACHB-252]|uniref:Uncharacterized protein n=1 Tax=Nostoc punctiforme FACHB-252 TaxID=1357509 RepID=A0ABR8HLM9_NOSPU|nr:hypothetical protein [Nostoc punctiforme]MBD2616252.1 hypothetical protein [Nostoc punctiforme FACHB-252]
MAPIAYESCLNAIKRVQTKDFLLLLLQLRQEVSLVGKSYQKFFVLLSTQLMSNQSTD